jgi:serine protease Do
MINLKKLKASYVKTILINVLVAGSFFIIGSLITLGVTGAKSSDNISEILDEGIVEEYIAEYMEDQPIVFAREVDNSETRIGLYDLGNSITEIVEKVSPSVVNIHVTLQMESFRGRVIEGEGVGSGIIYNKEGYIITNSHVVATASEIIVILHDGSEYDAEIIGFHEDTDIAVVKIAAYNLMPLDFSSINEVEVGEIAIAVGSPFGFSQSVTMGIISAKERDISVSSDTFPMVDLIQTDAAINQGNSGGPLLNLDGQVIGINSLIFSTSGTNAGIGFAIPSDTAVNIADQIIKYGQAKIPYIGFNMGENTTSISGVYIESINYDSPAEEAGLRQGDIIIEMDSTAIKTSYDILAQILRRNVGDILKIEIYRDGDYIELEIELM